MSTETAFPISIRWTILLVLSPFLIYLGNPAIALLVGAAISLGLNRTVIPAANSIGKYSLQIAVVLLGLKLNANDLIEISSNYSLLVTTYVLLTLGVGLLFGWLLKNEPKSSQLMSSGTAICGGTTIASLSPVIAARPEQTAVALTLVFLLNAVALFSYPHIGEWLDMTQEQFGVWCALSIHDTSSVVATALIYGDEAATVATTLKLGRTLWLVPLLIVAGLIENRQGTRVTAPMFIVFFIAAAGIGSLLSLPPWLISAAGWLSKALLVLALFAIGSEITRATLAHFRGVAVVHGVLLWLLIAPASLFVVLKIL